MLSFKYLFHNLDWCMVSLPPWAYCANDIWHNSHLLILRTSCIRSNSILVTPATYLKLCTLEVTKSLVCSQAIIHKHSEYWMCNSDHLLCNQLWKPGCAWCFVIRLDFTGQSSSISNHGITVVTFQLNTLVLRALTIVLNMYHLEPWMFRLYFEKEMQQMLAWALMGSYSREFEGIGLSYFLGVSSKRLPCVLCRGKQFVFPTSKDVSWFE